MPEERGQTGPEVTIRELQASEYLSVMRLWREAGLPFRPEGRDRPERVAVELESGQALFLVAEAEGKLVGTVLGTHDGRKGWINRLAVSPSYRRQGIARLLVCELESWFASLGLEITAAQVESHNETSLTFFRAIGYVHGSDIEYFSKRRGPEV